MTELAFIANLRLLYKGQGIRKHDTPAFYLQQSVHVILNKFRRLEPIIGLLYIKVKKDNCSQI